MTAGDDPRDKPLPRGSLATTIRRHGDPSAPDAATRPGGLREASDDALLAPPSTTPDSAVIASDSTTLDAAVSETMLQPKAGARDEALLAAAASPSRPRGVVLDAAALEGSDFADRYAFRSVIGRGGMGEVRLCRDVRIGRDIAIKVLRQPEGFRPVAAGSTGAEPRFLREARVQGQLEHPAIVPVYDLGRDPDGEAYFTMKRIRGLTLEEVVSSLRGGDAETARRFSRRKLLTAFSQVCLAIDFAHSRGVVHRDLKPGNVMLGDFGEVHVLDWGIARIAGVPDVATDAPSALAADDGAAHTQEGEMLGTPGYMAPEQVRGAPDVDRRADVYALGCVLFELLSMQPLHARTTLTALLASTLSGVDARPSSRAPELELPPELDDVCVRATALAPADRYPTARALCDDIERYLDGDRDLERRRQLADEHAARAAVAAEKALQSGELEPRKEAMLEAGRALALDPRHPEAARNVLRLLLDPPKVAPVEATIAREQVQTAAVKLAGRRGMIDYSALFLTTPIFLWLGFRQLWIAFAAAACLLAAIACCVWMWRRPEAHLIKVIGTLAAGTTCVVLGSWFAGPLVLLPAMVMTHTTAFVLRPGRAYRWMLIAVGTTAILLPALLEWTGVVPASYSWSEAGMLVSPTITDLPELPTRLALIGLPIASLVNTILYLGAMRDALDGAEWALHVQAWQLRQLVPAEAHGNTASAAAMSLGPRPVGTA